MGVDRIVWAVLPANRGVHGNPALQLASTASDFTEIGIQPPNWDPHSNALAEAMVKWTGGPDLVISFFMPPQIQSQGGNPVYITEHTQNIGILEPPASTTRYSLATSLPFDVGTARVIGER